MPNTPLIALPVNLKPGQARFHIDLDYTDAVVEAGGSPLLVPLTGSPTCIESFMGAVDGLCLTGSGSDVNPGLYGEEVAEFCGEIQPLRDTTDGLLLGCALRRGIPILGICYGFQRLNVFFGGSLHQDLEASGYRVVLHKRTQERKRSVHPLRLSGDPLPSRYACLEELRLSGTSTFAANSSHHQAVKEPGTKLTPFAWAPDGVVEGAYVAHDTQFILGVQWHPEEDMRENLLSECVWKDFLRACGGGGNWQFPPPVPNH